MGGMNVKNKKWRQICAAFVCCLLVLPVGRAAKAERESVSLPIIMYHQINKSPESWGDYVVSPQTFEDDLDYLAAHGYQTVTTQQLIDYSQGVSTLPEKPVLITFDDGGESFETYALPALEKHGMSAVLAIVGKYADLYTEAEDHNVSYSHFSWPALEKLRHSEAVELAVHTYDMHKLGVRQGCRIKPGESGTAYSEALNADLDKIEARFQEYLGGKPCVFAYPYGFYCTEAREILQQRGYKVLFTCEERVNVLTGDPQELMNLARFNRAYGISRERFFGSFLKIS